MCPSAKMTNPYESYIRMLLPLLVNQKDGSSSDNASQETRESEQLPARVTISICTDNARPLANDASMTMKRFKPKVSSAMSRWSSVPDLQGFKASTKSRSSSSRSIDDLRSLMTNNSKRPTSTDNLRAALSATALARRQALGTVAPPSRGNDRWESKPSRQPRLKNNPFDLQIPGLPTSRARASRPKRIARSHTTPSVKSGVQCLRLPKRTVSMEAVTRDLEPGRPNRIEEEPCKEATPQESKAIDLLSKCDEPTSPKEGLVLELTQKPSSRAA